MTPGLSRLPLLFVCGSLLTIAGCAGGGSNTGSVTGGSLQSHALTGLVHGGQQPVSGAKVYLYAQGTTGYGAASRSLLAAPGYVTTNEAGYFTFSSFSCGATDQVYVLATGGDAGAGPNANIALMTAIGSCQTLLANVSTAVVSVNEVTTVASVYALAPYLSGAAALGAPTSDATGLAQAFAAVNTMANVVSGAAPATVANGGTVPQASINSLADTLAACVNSVSPFTVCSSLYSATSYGGGTPADTVAVAISVAQHPLHNVSTIYTLSLPASPYQPTLSAAPGSWSFATSFAGDVLTYHNDASRSGVQAGETALTPANVTAAAFGKKYTFPVDGYLWAQPVYVGNYTMADGATRNVVFAASANSSVYAFDADGDNPARGYLWKDSLVGAGEVPMPYSAYNCGDEPVQAGITGTPVIDRTTGTLYVVSVTALTSGGNTTYYQRLHALNLGDGTEKFGAPSVIAATASGTGSGAVSGVLTFSPSLQHQHAALLLANGNVDIAWASHCDVGNYHGWLMSYNYANVSQQTGVWVNTPNGSEGGIWMSIGGPSADASGNLYLTSGNGVFDANSGGSDLGESIVRIPPPAAGSTKLVPADYFVPSNEQTEDNQDQDFGTTNALLFSDTASGVAPNLAVASDKLGRIYLFDAGNLGKFETGANGPNSLNGDLEDWVPGGSVFNNFAYFNGNLYVGTSGQPLEAFAFAPGNSSQAGSFNTTPASQTSFNFSSNRGAGGASPSVSANGTANAIVWAIERGSSNDILYAFTASNLALLYSSSQAAGNRDLGPTPIKFSSATVGGGHVFVPGQSSLVVYGLF